MKLHTGLAYKLIFNPKVAPHHKIALKIFSHRFGS